MTQRVSNSHVPQMSQSAEMSCASSSYLACEKVQSKVYTLKTELMALLTVAQGLRGKA